MRFRITQTVVAEYDVDPEHYLGVTDPQKMLAIDVQNVKNDELIIFSLGDDDAKITVQGEVLQ